MKAQRPLVGLSLAMLLSSLGTSIANVGLPTLVRELGASFQAVQWVVLAYLLAITTLIVTVGRLGDLMGRRRLLVGGLAVFTVASALCGTSSSLWQLIAARTVQGLGAAVMMALTVAFVGETVPKERTGSAMGMLGTMSAIGTAMGPALGGGLIAAFGWRAIFLAMVPLGLVALYLAVRHLPADRRAPVTGRPGFDAAGTLLLALALGSYALAMTLGRGHFGPLHAALLLAAAVAGALFLFAESRVRAPLLHLSMLRRTLCASLAMSALVSTVMMATLVVGPFYLVRGLGLDAARVGMVMSAGPLVAALTGVPAGRLVDRLGAPRVTVIGLAGVAIGCLLLSAMPAELGGVGYVVATVVGTASYALFQAANNTAVMAGVASDQRGVVSGTLNLSRNLGLITGASVMGAVFAFATGTADVTRATAASATSGMHVTFAVGAALAALGLVIGLFARGRASGPLRA